MEPFEIKTHSRFASGRISLLVDDCAVERGLTGGKGRYGQFRQFKTVWQTNDRMLNGGRDKSVDMVVTDYMHGAPDPILKEYLLAQVDDCIGIGRRLDPCSEPFSAFMDSDYFLLEGQGTYLSRSTTLEPEIDEGTLHYAKAWLEARKLVPERADEALLCWDHTSRGLWRSSTNIMFKVVEIPTEFKDRGDLDPAVLYLMFRQMCLMSTPFDPIGFSHESDADELYGIFPRDVYEEAMEELQDAGMWKSEMRI